MVERVKALAERPAEGTLAELSQSRIVTVGSRVVGRRTRRSSPTEDAW